MATKATDLSSAVESHTKPFGLVICQESFWAGASRSISFNVRKQGFSASRTGDIEVTSSFRQRQRLEDGPCHPCPVPMMRIDVYRMTLAG